jgi:hypothetical protein
MPDSITPSPELVAKLWREASAGRDDAPIGEIFNHGIYLAYAAGADQELEACCAELPGLDDYLRAARRPKLWSLKEQALAALREACEMANDRPPEGISNYQIDIIRRALEALPND